MHAISERILMDRTLSELDLSSKIINYENNIQYTESPTYLVWTLITCERLKGYLLPQRI